MNLFGIFFMLLRLPMNNINGLKKGWGEDKCSPAFAAPVYECTGLTTFLATPLFPYVQES